jgi:hypothetical protein
VAADELTRKSLLIRASALAAGGILAQLPGALRAQGWLEEAADAAARPDLVHETLNGLVAFVVPGKDRYSEVQGTRTGTPGGIEAGATAVLIETLDTLIPSLSATAAAVLNQTALAVRPGAARGRFRSAFANLSAGDKARVFQRLDALEGSEAGSIRYLAGNLPGLAAFASYSEAGAFDPRRRRLRKRPVGWRLSHYSGVADGRADLKGYFQGRRQAGPDA